MLKTANKQVFFHFKTESGDDTRKPKLSLEYILLVLEWCFRGIWAVY